MGPPGGGDLIPTLHLSASHNFSGLSWNASDTEGDCNVGFILPTSWDRASVGVWEIMPERFAIVTRVSPVGIEVYPQAASEVTLELWHFI
jgi:hypothetical protein